MYNEIKLLDIMLDHVLQQNTRSKTCLAVAKAQTLRWPGLCYLIPGIWQLSTSITVENKVCPMGTVK